MTTDDIKFELAAGRAMTRDEAERMLTRLRGHYGEPVMPISKYCDKFREWLQVMYDRMEDLKAKVYPGINGPYSDPETVAAHKRCESDRLNKRLPEYLKYYEDIIDSIEYTSRLVRKSSFLARRLYGNEKLRTKECPVHQGRWSGLEHDGNRCEHNCHLTGWIYEGQE